MKIYNDATERSVGVSSTTAGEFIGISYSTFSPPSNGLIIAGNLGIGTFAPQGKLHVKGASLSSSVAKFEGLSGTLFEVTDVLTGTLFTVNNISGIPNFWVTDGYSNPIINVQGGVGQTANYLSINSVIGTSYVAVQGSNGFFGLSTFAPGYNLHVQGSAFISGILNDTNKLAGTKIGVVSQFLASTGVGITWAPIKRNLVVPLVTAFTPTGVGIDTAVFIVPYDPIDGASTINWSTKRLNWRVELISLGGPAGISTLQVLKSTATGGFAGTAMLSSAIIISGVNEGATTGFTGFGATAVSNDKISLQFTGVSTFHANFTVELLMRESG